MSNSRTYIYANEIKFKSSFLCSFGNGGIHPYTGREQHNWQVYILWQVYIKENQYGSDKLAKQYVASS